MKLSEIARQGGNRQYNKRKLPERYRIDRREDVEAGGYTNL